MTSADPRNRHVALGPNPTEAAMLEAFDHFARLLEKKPRVAATFAAETLERAKQLTESTVADHPATKRNRSTTL